MNIGELRKIIHEEVVKAMREELRDILTEAALTLEEQRQASRAPRSMPVRLTDIVQEQEEEVAQPKSIMSMLQETATGMTREDYKAFTGAGEMVRSSQPQSSQPIMAGMPDFMTRAITNAKGVLDASNQRDLERHGL